MSKPFNFYGQNSGVAVPTGTPTNFSFFFTDINNIPSGVYLPPDFIGSSFSITVDNDAAEFPMGTATIPYGEILAGLNEEPGLAVSFYGDAYPAPTETGATTFRMHGGVSGEPFDTPNMQIIPRAQQSGVPRDNATLQFHPYGDQLANANDFPNFQAKISGDMAPSTNDYESYVTRFKGNSKAVQKDTVALDFVLVSILYESGGGFVTPETFVDTGYLDFVMTTIIYNN